MKKTFIIGSPGQPVAYQKVNLAQAIQKAIMRGRSRQGSSCKACQLCPLIIAAAHQIKIIWIRSSNKNYLELLFASKSEVYREYKTQCTVNGKASYHKTGFK